MRILLVGQAGDARLAGLIFIKLSNSGMHKTEVRHHRLTRAISIARENGVHHRAVLFGQTGKNGRHEIHALAALFYRGLQQVEEAAHRLQQHHIMRGFCNGEMETHIRLRREIGVIRLRGVKAQGNLLFIRFGGAHGGMPCGAGFNGVTGFEDIKAVIGVIAEQRFQRLNNILF